MQAILEPKEINAKAKVKIAELAARMAELQDQIMAFQQERQFNFQSGGVRVILPELHDAATGRIDAQKVADLMGVPLKRFAEGIGLSYKAAHRNPSAEAYQEALQPVKRSLEILHEFFGKPPTIRAWRVAPVRLCDGFAARRLGSATTKRSGVSNEIEPVILVGY